MDGKELDSGQLAAILAQRAGYIVLTLEQLHGMLQEAVRTAVLATAPAAAKAALDALAPAGLTVVNPAYLQARDLSVSEATAKIMRTIPRDVRIVEMPRRRIQKRKQVKRDPGGRVQAVDELSVESDS